MSESHHRKRLGVGASLVLALALGACVSDDATVTTTPSAPETTTTSDEHPGLVPLEDHVTGLTGLRPEGWEELAYGTFVLEEGEATSSFTAQFHPGATEDDVLAVVGEVIGGLPTEPAGTFQGGTFTFSLHEFESAGGVFEGSLAKGRVGIAEVPEGAYVVALSVDAGRVESVWAELLEPAFDALGPWGSAEDAGAAIPADAAFHDPALSPADRAADLVARMTLREKLGQMTLIEKGSIDPDSVAIYGLGGVLSGGGGSPAENTPAAWAEMVRGFQEAALTTRIGIPILYGVDSVHGHANLAGATVFPHNIGLGASGDAGLVERIGRATALETAATGIRWNFAPVLAIPSDVRWGRTYEAYGQDPALVGLLGAAYVRGLQGDDLADPMSVLATAKHFVGDGSTDYGTSTTDDYLLDQGVTEPSDALLDNLLAPYESVFSVGAGSVMASFSSWGEDKVHESSALLTGVLRDDMGFSGMVVSDWGGVDQIDPDYYQAVLTATAAGIDMNMVPYDPVPYMWSLSNAVGSGALEPERIDQAVTRILEAKFALGLFESPYPDPGLLDEVGSAEHRALAREAVAKSAVLLKNDGVLPLASEPKTILVAGRAADDVGIQSGGWTLTWQGRPGPVPGGHFDRRRH